MPDADGRIPPVRMPEIPWLQRFEDGERVRVIDGVEGFAGDEGSVVMHTAQANSSERSVMVEIDDMPWPDAVFMFTPGELRRVR